MQRILNIRIHRVLCIDETGGSFTERFGNDEIWLCGYSIDNNNNVAAINPINIYSHFDDGDVKRFREPVVFHQFAFDDAVAAPQNFAVVFILVERDLSDQYGMHQYVRDAMQTARANLIKYGSAVVPGSGNQLSYWEQTALKVASWARGVMHAFTDDFFPAVMRTSTISNGAVSDPYLEYFEVKAHDGTYKVEHDWLIS